MTLQKRFTYPHSPPNTVPPQLLSIVTECESGGARGNGPIRHCPEREGDGGGFFELPTYEKAARWAWLGTQLPGVPVIKMFQGEVDFPK